MMGLEDRSRAVFRDSVDGLDMSVLSRLTQARHAALEAAAEAGRRPWILRLPRWMPAAGVTAAAVLGAAVWFGSPLANLGSPGADAESKFEDLDLVAASDGASGDTIDMLQDDIDFYDWADKAANSGPAA